MSTTLDAPRGSHSVSESVHFPWAHVDDFRHFFGLDRLLAYSRRRTLHTARFIVRLLALGSDQRPGHRVLATRMIAVAHAIETTVVIKGTLAPRNNLDDVIRANHPAVASEQREKMLADYLHRNAVLPRADLAAQMHTGRLAGVLAHHAADLWRGEHSDLFALVARLEHPMRIRFVLAAVLHALPERSLTSDEAERFLACFADWPLVLDRALGESKRALPDSPASITSRATLQSLHEAARRNVTQEREPSR